jgi:WhiB family redox-sensing transcriptional regulator
VTHYNGSVPETEREPDWRTLAACKGAGDAMFPSNYPPDIEDAKDYCRACPVTSDCLQWALETGQEFGVWGGLSEAERRILKRRTRTRAISVDDYTGIPATRTPIAGRTLQQAWDDGTQADGEHLLWVGKKTVHHSDGAVTPNRLAFYLDRGHWPEGDVKRTCGVDRCVKPAHLADRRERAEEADLAVAV